MTIAAVTIGNELLNGETLNTNLQILGEELKIIGLTIDYAISISDNEQQIINALTFLEPLVEIIIIVGGLGPTHDDISRKVIAQFAKKKLIFCQQEYDTIITKAVKNNYNITPQNARKESMLVEDAQFIVNGVGYAAGIQLKHNKTKYFLFPGSPREFIPMIQQQLITQLTSSNIYQQNIYTCGLRENQIQELINPYLNSNTTIAICAKIGEVRITLSGTDEKNINKTKRELTSLLSTYVLKQPSLEENIFELISQNNWTLATAESCTGGLISSKLTNLAGISTIYKGSFITYTNKWKQQYLNVKQEILDEFGAVSQQVAKAMAEGLASKKIDCGICVTGIAGPKSDGQKPIGLVFIATFTPLIIKVQQYNFTGNRQDIRYRIMINGLNQLRLQLLENN